MTESKEGKIRLGKIQVKMGEKQVDLTVEQARELCALLKGLFGDDATKIIHVKDYWYPNPWYVGLTGTYQGYYWTYSAYTTDTEVPMPGNSTITNVTYTLTGG